MQARTTPQIPNRELQVLALVVEGNTTKEIAAVLGLSPSMVTGYRKSLHARLGCSNAASLVRIALESDLVPRQTRAAG